MSVELRPLGVNCNIACQYCYQNPQRDAGNLAKKYDIEKMKAAVLKEGGPFVLFGGEPLMLPIKDLEDLFAWGYEKFGQNMVQTNGTLINDEHIALFKKYRVNIGLSIDGPGELNDIRWAGSLEKTREMTAKIEAIIPKLLREGLKPGMIITLHKNNATEEHLPRMHQWLKELDELGIESARLHILEVDDPKIQEKYALSEIENIKAFLSFATLEKELKNLKLDTFTDMEHLLVLQDDNVSCVWRACDPYNTEAVRGIEGFGESSNCGRTNKDGIDYLKADKNSYERYLALYYTPQEFNGCQSCRYFAACKGQCPGTSADGDWRNRTEHCDVWKSLFSQLEDHLLKKGVTPMSLHPNLPHLEKALITSWSSGFNLSLRQQIELMKAPQKAPLNS